MNAHRVDFLVLGSGIAGLSFALEVAGQGSVAVVTKKESAESATNYAQGGVAAVMSHGDSIEAHVKDTLKAGAGLCRENVVRRVVEKGPEAVQRLMDLGVAFDRKEGSGSFDLGREGGHSARRVLHAADLTGRAIETALVTQAEKHPHITMYQDHLAVDLVTSNRPGQPGPSRVYGAYVLNASSNTVETFAAPVVLLATGGCGKVYLYTSNPEIASGDGIAMAYRAGAPIANMEFIQFHPTCLYHPQARSFLISEAVRGEGAFLLNAKGERFMARHHDRADLAPRDIVARAIDLELKTTGADCVHLDCRDLGAGFLHRRFPHILKRCLELGLDMTTTPLPVVPAAHFSCGGVRADLNGETGIRNLFAAGEVSCTGLHGANRLASNSLLEGVVYARLAAREVLRRFASGLEAVPAIPAWDRGHAADPAEEVMVSANWDEIRRLMWNYVGIVRSDRRLERARRRIAMLQEEIRQYYWDFRLTTDLVELRNLAQVAELIVDSALLRRESRGLHYTLDAPQPASGPAKDTILSRGPVS